MKKGKFLIVGLIGLLMAGALVFVGCGDKCSSEGSCIVQTDSDAGVIRALDCSNSGCSVTSLGGSEPRPNMNIKCNCD